MIAATASIRMGGFALGDSAGMRLRTMVMVPPQQGHTNTGRAVRMPVAVGGLSLNRYCSSVINFLLLGCRNPKLRARRNPLGRTWRSSKRRKSAPGSVRVCIRRVLLFR